jgi:hypothetical protein
LQLLIWECVKIEKNITQGVRMKKIIMAATLMTTVSLSNVVNASCLDAIPTNKKMLTYELKLAHGMLANDKEMEIIYKDLAISAKGTRDLSLLVATGSTLPIALLSGGYISNIVGKVAFSTGFQASIGLAGSNLLGASTMFGPFVANGIVSVKMLKNVLKENNFNEEEANNFIENTGILALNRCSFKDANEEANKLSSEVLNTDFDGSIKNTILDHITFGSVSKRATEKLYAIAKIKTLLSEMKVEELKKYKFE